jgi:hypothetical protein
LKSQDIQIQHGLPDAKHPSAWLHYELPQEAKIALEVYDMAGEKLATLVDEKKPAGKHEYDFNMQRQRLTAGSYYCRFAAYDDAERLFYVSVNKLALR